MNTRNIIEGLNKHIENRREARHLDAKGHIVLQEGVIPNESFKVFNYHKIVLWFVQGKKSYVILSYSIPYKVTDDINKVRNVIYDSLCESLFNWIGSESYEKVVKGKYNGISEDSDE